MTTSIYHCLLYPDLRDSTAEEDEGARGHFPSHSLSANWLQGTVVVSIFDKSFSLDAHGVIAFLGVHFKMKMTVRLTWGVRWGEHRRSLQVKSRRKRTQQGQGTTGGWTTDSNHAYNEWETNTDWVQHAIIELFFIRYTGCEQTTTRVAVFAQARCTVNDSLLIGWQMASFAFISIQNLRHQHL